MADSVGQVRMEVPLSVELRVWRIAKRSGSPAVSESLVQEHVSNANVIWQRARMSFSIISCLEWVSSEYYKINSYSEFEAVEAERWDVRNNCIDVYYVKKIISGGTTGVCSFPEFSEPHAIAMDDQATPTTLAHELGHFFKLEHTWLDDLSDTQSSGYGDPSNVMSYDRVDNVSQTHLTAQQIERARRAAFQERANMIAPIFFAVCG